MQSSRFKGLNGTVGMVTLDIENCNEAGPTRTAVNGPDGGGINLDSLDVDGCVKIHPIAISSPANEKLYVVRRLAFSVRQAHANQHTGRPLSPYNLIGPVLPWTYAGGNVSPLTSAGTAR